MDGKRSRPQATETDSKLKIYVRRGALWRYNRLKRDAANLPLAVEWDRRTGERRQSPEEVPADQRTVDRRKAPPATWQLAEFVVVDGSREDGSDEDKK